ncbi:MAG: hypothetical protein WCY09_08480 [Candidatus Omnitrophota bacterium]
MVDLELKVSDRLAGVLPPLTDEERKQLEDNLISDGRVLDPILYWYDGKNNVVLDGMNRLPLAKQHGIPYRTEPVNLGTTDYDKAELWVLKHQFGRRNMLDPQKLRLLIGDLYNRLKRDDGGHGDQKSGRHGDTPNVPVGDQGSGCQNDTPITNAAEETAELTGVSESSVKRRGATVNALDKCCESFQKGVRSSTIKATDAQIKAVAKLKPDKQEAISRECRFGKTLTEALAKRTPPKADKGGGKTKPDAPKPGEQKRDPRLWKEIEGYLGKSLNRVDALHRAYPNVQLHGTLVKQVKQCMTTLEGWKESAS